MSLSGLQGRTLTRAVDEVRTLLTEGEVSSMALRRLEDLSSSGLWLVRGDMLIATPTVVALGDRLPASGEMVPAVFSLLPEVRNAWLSVVRARLAEMGERNDLVALTEAIQAAGALATELVKVAAPSLAPTSFGELERAVLPAAAHEAAAFPVLLRVLAATAVMPDGGPTGPLPEMAFDDPGTAWRPGRLLRLPVAADSAPAEAVLSGALEGRSNGRRRDALGAASSVGVPAGAAHLHQGGLGGRARVGRHRLRARARARWLCFRPPPRVEVVVTLPSGEEIRCGSLGELVQRTLAQLGVTLLGHRVTANTLDDKPRSRHRAVLRRDVWRFEHGSGARRPGYSIHPLFSDACYRALGSRAFYRLGSPVTAAIRRAAEGLGQASAWRAQRRGEPHRRRHDTHPSPRAPGVLDREPATPRPGSARSRRLPSMAGP
jgi:hypothetical protein